jgi:hypothetical protein
MVDTPRKMKYGAYSACDFDSFTSKLPTLTIVRLGKSGLKVSKIVLGCMSYGISDWNPWILDEEESLVNIKKA